MFNLVWIKSFLLRCKALQDNAVLIGTDELQTYLEKCRAKREGLTREIFWAERELSKRQSWIQQSAAKLDAITKG